MERPHIAKISILINAPASKVWQTLTDPEKIKEFMFGTTVNTDWKEGSSIVYTGEWEGRPYEDKGTILKSIPNELLVTSYWSSFSGLEDKEENYQNVSYSLTSQGENTLLTITQDNIPSKETAEHSANNWKGVLEKIKEII